MKKNFRVEVENLGIADVNLSSYLKPKYIYCQVVLQLHRKLPLIP